MDSLRPTPWPPQLTRPAGRQLNLGCGTDVRPGFVNLDVAPLPGVDVVHDLDDLPLPFEDGSFAEVVCKDLLEHVDLGAVLSECHRLLVPGGLLHMQSPHFTASAFYADPTHRRAFSIETLHFFAAGGRHDDRSYYFGFRFQAIASERIVFHRNRVMPWNGPVERLVNSSPKMQKYYEETFLARIFPALNVQVTLVK
jgi:SAM-dependent methyltransferase